MTSPIDDYLKALKRELPWPRRRLVHEIRAHLEEARERLVAAGVDRADAERAAVERFGEVSAVAAAICEEGGPMMSPRARRVVPYGVALLTLPTVVFVVANAIETLAGNAGGVGVFGDAFGRWETPLNLLLSLGPFVSLVLIAVAGIRLRVTRRAGGIDAHVHVRLSRGMVVVTILVTVVALGTAGYLLSENVFCVEGSWRIC